ncbi:MAG: YhbD family protein [Clostridium sp.]|jgi:DNA-binding transcriptional MerR regulator|uniref:YhbD family protein n=1 Tax=Clostridium sp. TaxID=1506 RepID=UPI0025BFCFEC|nr:YhbD family protein [Clostridium sp.]MCH3963753.1 YhbD family protein [Clostridium sp.]MCI1714894.1 YhbD family protein [Clostridium sp.]MCI1798917.1 YhbD family protein [Clostridium sp.]MCI1813077.1 YhbD family protein [Clostridium sp.]MCI1869967.1 YhbD family protein [Clostridium sp.]
MEENLISKKELLELSNISYGQLYRWKRKKLIPEEWFIKKSSFTGQETFFPREEMLGRIERIKSMKDDISLDDMAQIFSNRVSNIKISHDDLIEKGIIMKNVLKMYSDFNADFSIYSFNEVLYMDILQEFLTVGNISVEESKIVIQTLQDNYNKYSGRNCEIVFVRKIGVGVCFISLLPNEICFDNLSKVIMRLDIGKVIEKLKLKIEELF